MNSAATRYRELVADLVAASRRHTTARAAAQESYDDACAALERDVTAAQEAVALAENEVDRAQRAVAETDQTAATLWEELKRLRGGRLGPLPEPIATEDDDPTALLDSASARINDARRDGSRLPRFLWPIVLGLGVCLVLAAWLTLR